MLLVEHAAIHAVVRWYENDRAAVSMREALFTVRTHIAIAVVTF